MLREFTDAGGTTWQVWDVYPMPRGRSSEAAPSEQSQTAFPNRALSEGWLCFQCDGEKRRLAPIPPDWEICDCAVLEALCKRAGYSSLGRHDDRTSS